MGDMKLNAECPVPVEEYFPASQPESQPQQDGPIKRYDIFWGTHTRRAKMLQTEHGQYVRTIDYLRAEAALTLVREALKGVLEMAPEIPCENWHHAKKDRHDGFTPCPVKARWDATVKQGFAALAATQPGKTAPTS